MERSKAKKGVAFVSAREQSSTSIDDGLFPVLSMEVQMGIDWVAVELIATLS